MREGDSWERRVREGRGGVQHVMMIDEEGGGNPKCLKI
jgi:hypothetical protein